MKRLIIVIFSAVFMGVSPAWADQDDSPLFDRGRDRYLSASKVESKVLQQNTYQRAASDFQEFLHLYPEHPKAMEGHFYLGKIYHELSVISGDREEAGRALHHYREVAKSTPRHELANEAWLGVSKICGEIFKDLRCQEEAMGHVDQKVVSSPVPPVLSSSSTRAELQQIQVDSKSGPFTLSLRFDQPVVMEGKELAANAESKMPARYYLDIKAAHLPRSIFTPKISSNSFVSGIRLAQNTLETVRVVMDLQPSVSDPIYVVTQEDGLVKIQIRSKPEVTISTPPLPEPLVTQPTKSLAVKKVYKIVIDAGHGGEDTGAEGRRGTLEKDVTLAISKKLEKSLRENSRYEIFMTRSDDRTLALKDRTTYANRIGGDLFVSIHANASPKPTARGISTYFLDNADDEESLRVAMRENGDLALTSSPERNTSEEYYLEVMKASMIKNFHTAQSTDFARMIQSSLLENVRTHFRNVDDLGVRSARFYVLTGAQMPAILVETSFISNSEEEKRLRDKKYQDSIVRAIERGIERFVKGLGQTGDHASLYRP